MICGLASCFCNYILIGTQIPHSVMSCQSCGAIAWKLSSSDRDHMSHKGKTFTIWLFKKKYVDLAADKEEFLKII